jgi:hypothetical protein
LGSIENFSPIVRAVTLFKGFKNSKILDCSQLIIAKIRMLFTKVNFNYI